ncbi:UNVERIFIED_CONTAM: Pentatricopeptide repeat-containing protein, mitochondrial [Sesamum radiatum]|uniref:Pentatricopeptide repeat-containing protein, mitochondrial n=1 Tax=Sesamum radiatum TaxID=300843 RepID=A0AAW2QDI9_SESRA
MFGIHQSAYRFLHTVSFFTRLVDQCFSVTNPSNSLKLIHAQIIKLGLSSHTFLGNRCIDLYLKSGSAIDALKAFHDLPSKNIVSWNLYLKVYVKCFGVEKARLVFDGMPERDVVSWNTIISGCGNYAKEIHGCIVRLGGGYSNLVVGNTLIDVYGKLGLVDYALAVFLSMEKVDVISWNSMISGCCKSGYEEFALHKFSLMGRRGFKVDEYTMSAVLNACTNLRNLEKGKQVFCLCIKLGFLSNTVVSSAAIDLFSKCNRMENAISVFEESYLFDSAICNSMIACYASHDFEVKALELFVFSFSESIRPTEFTLSCVLYSAAVFVPVEQGSQLHSLVIKAGFEADDVVASSIVHMYSKYGLIDLALKVFADMDSWDLIAWNTMILALTQNGELVEAICLFEELLQSGLRPDRITFAGVLLACSYGGFLEEGMTIFSSMQHHGANRTNEHYASLADMMIRAGRIDSAIDLLHTMQCQPSALMWEFILRACGDYGDLNLIERVAERMMELEPHSSLPYVILANAYEQSGRWESLVRVRKKMKKMGTHEVADCSLICIKGHSFSFEANQMIHYGGKHVYSVLGLLMEEICVENDA